MMGTLSIWVVSAVEVSEPYGTINYTLNWSEPFTAQVITITGDDGSVITILDRNLWATAAWTGCEDPDWWTKCAWWDNTYWYHFQWWNNYGFNPNDSNVATNAQSDQVQSWSITYDPSNQQYYSGSTFIKWNNNWLNDNSVVDLWWWSVSDNTYDLNNNTWQVSNPTERKGPCPEWFHVPSRWELEKMKAMMLDNASNIHTQLKIPFAGSRYYDNASVNNLGINAILWSSSPYSASNPNSRRLYLDVGGGLHMDYSRRAHASSVRCFYDFYQPYTEPSTLVQLTFAASDGNGATSASTWAVEADTVITLSTWDYVATKNGWIHIWWNEDPTATWAQASITMDSNKTVYAIFEKDLTATYTATYAIIAGGLTQGVCTLYNTGTSCSITLPSITCDAWYHSPVWSPENLDNITSNTWATASCTANTYTVHFVAWEWTGTMNDQDFTYGVVQNLTANVFTKTGHIFSGWTDGTTGYIDGQEVSNLTTTNGDTVTLTAQWRANEHKLSFVVDGNVVQSWNVAYGTDISAPANPTKDCNSFAGWASSVEWLTIDGTMPNSDVTFTATWNYTCSRSSGWGGSRKSGTSTQDSSTSSQNNTKTSDSGEQAKQGNVNTQNSSSESQNDGNTQQKTYSEEFQKAYGFAHESWITTMDTIEKAEMDQPLTRIAMAKMLSQYAINVLWKKPANITVPKFKDVSEKLDTEYDNWVTLAYQLWIMWINMKNNEFRPFDYVTRAEFATALSRLLFDTPDGKDVYYSTHLRQLMEKKIITNDDPRLQELRGYVMIMLMRSTEDQ